MLDEFESYNQEFQKDQDKFGKAPENDVVKLEPYETGWSIIQKEGKRKLGNVYRDGRCEKYYFSARFGPGILPIIGDNPLQAATKAVERLVDSERIIAAVQAKTHYRIRTNSEGGVAVTIRRTQSYSEAIKFWKSVQPDWTTCESPKFWLESGQETDDSGIDWQIASKYAPPGVYC